MANPNPARPRPLYMGPRLKRLRRELGLTQQAMADDLAISPSMWRCWNATSAPSPPICCCAARTYRLDLTIWMPTRRRLWPPQRCAARSDLCRY
jgi:transcriptional regulator with XRE-family HTH domain